MWTQHWNFRFHKLLKNCWLEHLNSYQLIKKVSDLCSSSIQTWMLRIKPILYSFVWTMTLIQPSPPLEGSQRPGGSQLVLLVIISLPTARAVVCVFNSKLSPGLPRFYYNCRWIPCRLLRETKREINFRKQSHKGLVNDVVQILQGTRVGCKLSCLDVRNKEPSSQRSHVAILCYRGAHCTCWHS